MHRAILAVAAVLALAAGGCTFVASAQGGNTAKTNEAWFVETVGLPGLVFAVHVYYCPPLGSGGAATCQEAEMVENAQPAAGGGATPAPSPTPPPPPAPAGGDAPPAGE